MGVRLVSGFLYRYERSGHNQMTDYRPIPCTTYDELELACIKGTLHRITLVDGVVEGIANTLTNDGTAEWLELTDQSGRAQRYRLDLILEVYEVTSGD